MIDMNALLYQLRAAGGDPNTVNQLLEALRANGTLNASLSPQTQANIERAAAAVQAGDYESAKAAAAQLMSTPDGAALTSTLLGMLGQ